MSNSYRIEKNKTKNRQTKKGLQNKRKNKNKKKRDLIGIKIEIKKRQKELKGNKIHVD